MSVHVYWPPSITKHWISQLTKSFAQHKNTFHHLWKVNRTDEVYDDCKHEAGRLGFWIMYKKCFPEGFMFNGGAGALNIPPPPPHPGLLLWDIIMPHLMNIFQAAVCVSDKADCRELIGLMARYVCGQLFYTSNSSFLFLHRETLKAPLLFLSFFFFLSLSSCLFIFF